MSRVGRGNPPAHTRFKPGTSGNPSGRPKGARAFRAELMAELAALVKTDDGEVSRQRAIVLALLREATKGNLRAIDAVIRACVPALGDAASEASAEIEDQAIVQALGASKRQAEDQ